MLEKNIAIINQVISDFFANNPGIKVIPAKDLMLEFIEAGLFLSDVKNGLPIRNLLRNLDKRNKLASILFVIAERKLKNTNWFFAPSPDAAVIQDEIVMKPSPVESENKTYRKDSDESYVLDLCDKVLNLKGVRQYRFDFLVGDSGVRLPVDIYYPSLKLVIEFCESQHTNPNKHFDKPDVMTVSGVHRGEQRTIYDQRRREVIPQHGLSLIEISYSDFRFGKNKKIVRDLEDDERTVAELLTL